MGNVPVVPARPAVPSGVTRICVIGYSSSHNVGRAANLAAAIASAHPSAYETWFYFSNFGYKKFLESVKNEDIPDSEKTKRGNLDNEKTIGEHTSAPFVWLEKSNADENESKKNIEAIGGRDMFAQWSGKTFPDNEDIQKLSDVAAPPAMEMFGYAKIPTYNKK
eukprot:CAMPEP_0194356884 /NCGR_PEP_ID=MMETSP0174-20130528/4453_1 /TAXON_ID=216777 /ORGANISM="Proboscia alata, Strain PI-D3" /LENGTH=163 /DNA_ID=CAMNT_0039126667 /DNA_START=57 /DNA_END=548 /DNA_ORIENTATION=-